MYASNHPGSTSLYLCHQPGRFASCASASRVSRCGSSVTSYSVNRSETSRALKLTRPSSIRLILEPEARIASPAASRVMPFASRSCRSCAPTSMRSTVGPLPGSAVRNLHLPRRSPVSFDGDPRAGYAAIPAALITSRHGGPTVTEPSPGPTRPPRDPDWLPPTIDTTVAHPARTYDYLLGGKDNFAADRAVVEKALTFAPEARDRVRANRSFLRRAVQFLA